MIRKISLITAAAILCFAFNACEPHPASQVMKDYDARQKALENGSPSPSSSTNTSQFFQKKSD